jgi:hypothetical protein
MKKSYVILMVVVMFLTGCKKNEVSVPMQVVVSQLKIVGKQANLVKSDTASIVIVRDSVANENTDTIYNVKASISIILDSTFLADKMEEALQLQINDIIFVPADSAFANNLITFLQSDPGTKTVIEFVSKVEKNKYLQLQNATKASFTGFSFHKLDPEALADPKITKLLDSYAKWLKTMKQDMDDNYGTLPQMYAYEGLPEAYGLYKKLHVQETKMTPKQKERFTSLLNLHKSIDFPE